MSWGLTWQAPPFVCGPSGEWESWRETCWWVRFYVVQTQREHITLVPLSVKMISPGGMGKKQNRNLYLVSRIEYIFVHVHNPACPHRRRYDRLKLEFVVLDHPVIIPNQHNPPRPCYIVKNVSSYYNRQSSCQFCSHSKCNNGKSSFPQTEQSIDRIPGLDMAHVVPSLGVLFACIQKGCQDVWSARIPTVAK